ncbi:hypothetical protein FGW37_30685 [Streptomyces rectiverticillatus]|uniref:DUF937 domain-containing protein n=1 Tax=Streptomyces rectiverticillatus TaxID=173860 RepID=UPI0015C367A5|nr:DUF937 domain-containing protein [Streptomyces rectiverticillatus]QLE75371.1 hypothetical protein FGW37_30685 [Streptomyces rectiverticillatus]
MGDEALQQDVLDELGEDRIQELAGELGTDADGATRMVRETVAALPEELTRQESAAPAGAAGPGGLGGLGGGLGGGLMSGVLGKITGPVAETVAKRTGLPVAQVTRALELLLPVVMTTIAKRRGRKK